MCICVFLQGELLNGRTKYRRAVWPWLVTPRKSSLVTKATTSCMPRSCLISRENRIQLGKEWDHMWAKFFITFPSVDRSLYTHCTYLKSSQVCNAQTFHRCGPSSTPSMSTWAGYGRGAGQGGFTWVLSAYPGCLHLFPRKTEHKGNASVQIVLTVRNIMLVELVLCAHNRRLSRKSGTPESDKRQTKFSENSCTRSHLDVESTWSLLSPC